MASFPRQLCPHTQRREIFSSYGSVGGVDILDTDSGPTVVCQKLNFPRSKRQSMCAKTVSLPLYSFPVKVSDASYDDCITKVKTNKQKLEKFLLKIKKVKGYLKQNESQRDDLKAMYTRIEEDEHFKLLKQMPQNYLNLVKEKLEMDEIGLFPSVNSSFTGGCLSQQNSGNKTCGVLLTVINSTYLYILPYNFSQDKELLKNEAIAIKENTNGKIYQIESAKFGRNIYCGVRHEKKCIFYRIEFDEERVNCICIGDFETESIFTSVAVSCYIPCEFAVATQMGDVYLVTSCKDFVKGIKVQNLLELRFRCNENWYWCDFGAHPRQLVLADRTGVAFCDIKTPDQEKTDIFAIPHSTLHNLERVMVCTVHPQDRFFCWIATNFSLLLIDQRRPNHPVLYTDHQLRTCPQYISISKDYLNEFNDNVVSVASQEQGEMCCFQVNVSQNKSPHFVGSPWRISKPSDFVYCVRKMGGMADKVIIKNRLDISLIGICCVPTITGLTGIQLTVHGDLFYQTYQETVKTNFEKTFGVCTGSEDWTIKMEDFDHCTKWLDEAAMLDFNNIDNGKISGVLKYKKVSLDLSNILEDEMFPHVMCELCLPSTNHGGTIFENQEVCYVCGHKMAATQNIKDAVKKNGIMQSNFEGKKLTDIKVEEFNDPKSQILLKLWKEDNVTKKDLEHLLIQLDKEREADRKEKAADTAKTNDHTKIKGASKKRKRLSSDASISSVQSDTGLTSKRRKRRDSGSSTHSIASDVSTVSSAGFLSTPTRISKKSRLQDKERQRQESESSELSTSLQPFKLIGSQVSSPSSQKHDLLKSKFMSPTKPMQSNFRNLSNLPSQGMTQSQHSSLTHSGRNSLPSSPQTMVRSSQNTLSSSQKSTSSIKRDSKKKKRHSVMGF